MRPECPEHCLARYRRQLVNLVADRLVKPFRHVASNEFDRGHAADIVRVRLPQWAIQLSARFIAPCLDGLGNLDFPLDAALAESLLKLRLVGPYNRETDWVFASPTMKGKQPLWPETLWRRYGDLQ